MLDDRYMKLGFHLSAETLNGLDTEEVEPLNTESMVIPKEDLVLFYDDQGNMRIPSEVQYLGTLI